MKRFLLTTSFVAPAVFALFHGCATDTDSPGTGTNNTMTGANPTTSGSAGNSSSTPSTSMGAGGNGPTSVTSTGNGGNAGSSVTSGGGDGGSSVTSGGGGGAAGMGQGGMGQGGMGQGGMGQGGKAGAGGAMGGMGGGGGAGGTPDITIDGLAGGMKSNFGFTWKDSWFLSPCYQRQMADCFTNPNGTTCPNQNAPDFEDRGSRTTETFKLGGAAGQRYLVTFKYNAVAEAKYHSGGSYADPAMVPATPIAGNPGTFNDTRTHDNTFYIGCGVGAMACTGAAATAQNATTSTYNVYRLRVLDAAGTLVGRYYMNAFPANGGWESHRTFRISYSHQIEVVGGGSIEMQSADSNCRAIANCGDGADVTNGACNAPRSLMDIGGDTAMIPATFGNIPRAQLNTITGANDPQHWFAQFAHFTITAVAAKP